MRIPLQSVTEECDWLEGRCKYTEQTHFGGHERPSVLLSTVQQGAFLLLWDTVLLRQDRILPFNEDQNSYKTISLLVLLHLP